MKKLHVKGGHVPNVLRGMRFRWKKPIYSLSKCVFAHLDNLNTGDPQTHRAGPSKRGQALTRSRTAGGLAGGRPRRLRHAELRAELCAGAHGHHLCSDPWSDDVTVRPVEVC